MIDNNSSEQKDPPIDPSPSRGTSHRGWWRREQRNSYHMKRFVDRVRVVMRKQNRISEEERRKK